MSDKLWGGRFEASPDQFVDEFGASISFDQLLANEDIQGSLAHVKMLKHTKILSANEADQIIAGLEKLAHKLTTGELEFSVANEDIHMNLEALLAQEIGPVAGKLHTARSRNDQVATDLHLYLKNRLPQVLEAITGLQKALLCQAKKHQTTLMPGFTHLQHAQPITYAHYLMAYWQMFKRDYERFLFNQKHTDICPLGAAALAGTTFPIDRKFSADQLGFSEIYANSLDAVSDRDFALEFLSNSSILMVHLSRFCEELILWCSYEFGYLELSDKFATGSSIMPQKKNPDVAEIMRGKTGRTYGNLMNLLTTLKGLPLTYNRDLQEDKIPFMDTDKTVRTSLSIMAEMLQGIRFRADKMEKALKAGFLNATELADYLVTKGIPFREAHHITGRAVALAEDRGVGLEELSLQDFNHLCDPYHIQVTDDVYVVLDYFTAVKRRNASGGTGPVSVKNQLDELKVWLAAQC